MDSLTVNNTNLAIKEYKGQRVVTFKDIDAVHSRPTGTARKRFNDNKERFISEVDYFKITPSEFRTAIGTMDKRQRNDITLITETGYLMLVKSFTDDLAWSVQRELVNSYFRAKTDKLKAVKELHTYIYNDMEVVTLKELENHLGIDHAILCSHLKGKEFIPNNDYYILMGRELELFKDANTTVSKFTSSLTLLTHKGYKKLMARINGKKTFSDNTVPDIIDKIRFEIKVLNSMLDVVYSEDLKADYFGIGVSISKLCNDIGIIGSALKYEIAPCLCEGV